MEFLKWARDQWDRVAAVAFGIAGALTLVLGWVGASNALYPAKQLPYIISGGLGGLFLVAVMATSWLSADLRDEWRKLDRLESELSRLNRHLDELAVREVSGTGVAQPRLELTDVRDGERETAWSTRRRR